MDATIALLALGTGLAVLATAVITLILAIKNRNKVQQVHVLMNSQMTAVVARVEQLVAALETSDTDVPPPPEHQPDEGN